MTKGYRCPTCGELSGDMVNGVYQCRRENCSSIWWETLDRPSAGEPRSGKKCHQCWNQTLQTIAKITNVEVLRCSSCGATLLRYAQES